MARNYSGDPVRSYYDEYADREWNRFDARPPDRVNLEIHRRFLARLVRPGDRVLEVGAGPGRFTIQLAQLGARITALDISPRQLELHAERVQEAGWEAAVDARELGDVVDLSRFADASFDVATAYGGPLSYVFERAGDALDELLRVTRPGGAVAFSVMSRWGTVHRWLEAFLGGQGTLDDNRLVVESGDLVGELAWVGGLSHPHECHLFTWEEIERLLSTRACRLIDASAANMLSLRADQALADLGPEAWETFLAWEEAACRSPGALSAGTHILVALRRG